MTLSDELIWRGSIKDYTFSDVNFLNKPHKVYHGIDGSADSLTIGNLAALIVVLRLLKNGYQVFILVGGATTMIGDPSGKLEERDLKSVDEIRSNLENISKQINKIFQGEKITIVNNYDWFKDINYLDFLREVGKFFNLSDLVARDFIKQRIGDDNSGISYAEFSYTLIQGYDYWYLNKTYGVNFQVGGSDQWGNFISGANLIKRKEDKEVHGMTIPLIIDKSTGVKFGKSEAGAIWLDPLKTTPTAFYQFFINSSDDEVEYLLKAYTFLVKNQVEEIMFSHLQKPELRLAQTRLAYEVTTLVHGKKMADSAVKVSDILTNRVDLGEISDADINDIKDSIPTIKVSLNASILDILVQTNLSLSKTEARQLLKAGAISINFKKIDRENLTKEDFIKNILLIKKGKAFKDSILVILN